MGLLATSLGFGVVQLDVSVVNVAIKPIGADLGGGVSGLQWVVGVYTVAFAALILSAGALGDRIGAKRVFIGGFALFTGSSSMPRSGWPASCSPCGFATETPRAADRDIDLPGQLTAITALVALAASHDRSGSARLR